VIDSLLCSSFLYNFTCKNLRLIELEVELPCGDRLRHLPGLCGQSDPQLNDLTPVDVLSDVFIVALLMLPSLAGLCVDQDTREFGVLQDYYAGVKLTKEMILKPWSTRLDNFSSSSKKFVIQTSLMVAVDCLSFS